VEAVTGYRLRVSGPVDITLFPSLELVAEDVGVAQPARGSDAEFATAKKLKFGLMLRGLLDGKMRVTEVTLIDPVIAVPKGGAKAQGAGGPKAGEGSPSSGGGMAAAEKLKNLTLDELVIENGTVILPASGKKPGKRIEKLDLEASLPAYDKPLSFDVSAIVDAKAMAAKGSIGNFGPFLEGAPAPVSLVVNASDMLEAKASLSGTATYKDDTLTFSQFTAKSGDKTLAGKAVYKDDTVTLSQFTANAGRDTFAGNAVYKDNVVTISSLRANVRGNVLAGSGTVNLSDKVPYIVASLAAKTLDVNTLTGTPKSKSSGDGGGKDGGGKGGGGKGGGSGWSNAKIDFSPLSVVNGKFALTAEQLVYNDIKISPVSGKATLNDGKLNATLSKFNLYGGTGNATVAVDASGKTPTQQVQVSLAKFDAYTFLKDAANFQSIEGKGTISANLGAAGDSQRDIVSTLGGKADIEFVNGAIRGVNIAKMIRNLGTGIVEGWQGGTTEKTDFASLGATFKVAKGQATTQDLHLAGPLVRMTGGGTVDLPAKRLKFRVDPQLVASLKGQGGKKDLAGLGVPIMIEGPWAKPKFYPDIKGILQDPKAAYERFKNFGDEVKNLPGVGNVGKTGDALSNVIKDGKVDKDALIEGIGGLLGGAAAAPESEMSVEPKAQQERKAKKNRSAKKDKKNNKNKKAKQEVNQTIDTEDGLTTRSPAVRFARWARSSTSVAALSLRRCQQVPSSCPRARRRVISMCWHPVRSRCFAATRKLRSSRSPAPSSARCRCCSTGRTRRPSVLSRRFRPTCSTMPKAFCDRTQRSRSLSASCSPSG
jgi:AsmA protein